MAFAKVGDTLPVFSGGGSELYSQDVEGGTLYLSIVKSPSGETLGTALALVPEGGDTTPQAVLTALNATTGTLPQGAITGAGNVTLITSNATPGAQTVRTAAQMLADMPGGYVGQSWNLRIVNTGAGTFTLTADGGATVTLTGTMTVAQNKWRDFVCTFTSATAATIRATAQGDYT